MAANTKSRVSLRVVEPGEAAAEPTTVEQQGFLLYLDPRELLGHRGNLRRELGDLTDLEASIAAEGVLQALTVVPDENDTFRVVAGHRRTAAASAVLDAGTWNAAIAPTVPCLVRPDLVGRPVDQIWTMLDENDHRTDLTASERAKGYAQLAAFEVPAAEIARRARLKVKEVTAAIRLDGMADDVKAKVDQGQINLDDILALKEFADEPAVEARIIAAAGTSWGVKHEIATERKKREHKRKAAELKAKLQEAGVREIPRPKNFPYESKAVPVSELVGVDGNRLNEDEVRHLDGFAAFVDESAAPEIRYVCLDPEALGLARPEHNRYRSPEAAKQAEREAEQAREAKKARQAALDTAGGVRRAFIQETWGSAKGVKPLLDVVMRVAAGNPAALGVSNHYDFLLTLVGGSLEGLESASVAHAQRVVVCRWIVNQEVEAWKVGEGEWHRKNEPEVAKDWFDRLAAAGYPLSQAETDLYGELVENIAAKARLAAQRKMRGELGQVGRADDDAPFFLIPVHDVDSGWWLAGDDLSDRVGEFEGGPEAVAEAQDWATDLLEREGYSVVGWQEDWFENGRAYFVSEFAAEPADDDGGDRERGDDGGGDIRAAEDPTREDDGEPAGAAADVATQPPDDSGSDFDLPVQQPVADEPAAASHEDESEADQASRDAPV